MRDNFKAAPALHELLRRVQAKRHLSYVVHLVAPDDLRSVSSSATGVLAVYGEYSDQTIYGAPANNHLARAWHDTIHMELQADIDMEGERRVSDQQALEAERLTGTIIADLVHADLWGQTVYYHTLKSFPTNQAAFVWHWLRYKTIREF